MELRMTISKLLEIECHLWIDKNANEFINLLLW